MMALQKMASLVAAAGLVMAPVAASAATPAFDFDGLRASTELENEAGQFEGGGFLIPLIVIVAVGLGLYFAIDGGDDEPTSP